MKKLFTKYPDVFVKIDTSYGYKKKNLSQLNLKELEKLYQNGIIYTEDYFKAKMIKESE